MGNSQIIYNREYVYFIALSSSPLVSSPLVHHRVKVKSVSAGGYGYIRRFLWTDTAAVLRLTLQTPEPRGDISRERTSVSLAF